MPHIFLIAFLFIVRWGGTCRITGRKIEWSFNISVLYYAYCAQIYLTIGINSTKNQLHTTYSVRYIPQQTFVWNDNTTSGILHTSFDLLENELVNFVNRLLPVIKSLEIL